MYKNVINVVHTGIDGKVKPVYFPVSPCSSGSLWSTVTFSRLTANPQAIDQPDPPSNSYGSINTLPRGGGKWADIRASGVIKMTGGRVGTYGTEHYLAQMPRASYGAQAWGGLNWCQGQWYTRDIEINDESTTWTEQGDFRYWSRTYPSLRAIVGSDDNAFQSALHRAQADAWVEVIRQYDLLTELGELHETITFGKDVLYRFGTLLEDCKRLFGPGAKTLLPGAAAAWMAYRYAIMPLVYSAKDIIGLLDDKAKRYKTARRRVDRELKNPLLPNGESFFHTKITGTQIGRVTVKGCWDSQASRLLGQVSVNPLTTAWELIPLSFVVDWFVNFGDVLAARTSTWSAGVEQILGCTAVRSNTRKYTYLRLYDNQRKHLTQIAKSSGAPDYVVFDFWRGEEIQRDLLLKVEATDEYDRTLFNESSLDVVVSPLLNWKRTLDGLILSITGLTALLRKVR